MGDKTKGLYQKFDVDRTDGRSQIGEKHHDCEYFVLDLDHDPHAVGALLAYAQSCAAEYPILAADLLRKLPSMRKRVRAERRFPLTCDDPNQEL
ncbi:hypothetical protein LCGC14_1795070 [marine sediment metagenome]|uniref:Uncharacterized protein n=1 Tax=marine sediment metagenome TaxID=412755 RepID=A0A0F9GRG4_9ZZZZ